MSEAAPPRRRRLLRWPALAAVLLVGLATVVLISARAAGYRPFHVPSEAMEPALRKGDRFIALMGAPDELKRGEVILVAGPNGSIYVERLAALPGDRIAIDQGIVVLNGKPVAQDYVGDGLSGEGPYRQKVRIFSEQFPGEEKPHRIFDTAFQPDLDLLEELKVPDGHVFLLGDNRDNSADSRVKPEHMGLGLVPVANIRGEALFHGLGSSRRLGQPID